MYQLLKVQKCPCAVRCHPSVQEEHCTQPLPLRWRGDTAHGGAPCCPGGEGAGGLSLSAGRCGEAGALRSCDVPAGVGFRDAGEWEALPVTETPSSFLCLQQPPPPVAAPGRPSSLLHSQGLAQTGGPECKFHGPGPTSLPMSLPSYSTGARQSAPAAAHHHPSCSCWAPAPFMPPTTPSQEPKLSQWPRGVAGTLGCWGVVSSGACLPEGLAGAGLLGQARAWA